MDLKPKFRADSFVYPADCDDIMKIQEEVQKKVEGKDLEEELKDLKEYEKANAILTLYGNIAYDEGYRKGLKSIQDVHTKIKIKNRSKNKFHYSASQEEFLKITKLVQKRMASKKQKKQRTEYCKDSHIEDTTESFVLSLTIHSFFEAGYSDITLNTNNMFKEMHDGDSERASKMTNLFNDVFSELLNKS
jgi:hypothetical protein